MSQIAERASPATRVLLAWLAGLWRRLARPRVLRLPALPVRCPPRPACRPALPRLGPARQPVKIAGP
jgi:hypothetical protein